MERKNICIFNLRSCKFNCIRAFWHGIKLTTVTPHICKQPPHTLTHAHNPQTPSHVHRSKVDVLHQKVGEVSTNTVHDIHNSNSRTSYPWTRDRRYELSIPIRIIYTTDTDTYSIDTWLLASSIRDLIKLTWCIVAAIDQVTSNPRIWTWFSL